jgi:hypothetical protein
MNIYNKQIVNPLLSKGIQNVYSIKNVVNVYTSSDLPAVLLTDTTYIIHGEVTTANNILVANQNTAIVGLNRDSDRLVYTGTGTFINVLDADFFINNICFEATELL